MHRIQNSCVGSPTFPNRIAAAALGFLSITGIALAAIALGTSGNSRYSALLGISSTGLVLDVIWVVVLCKKGKGTLSTRLDTDVGQDPSDFKLWVDNLQYHSKKAF